MMQLPLWTVLSLVAAIAYACSSNMIFYLGKQTGGFNMTALNCAVYAIVGFVIGPSLALVELQKHNRSAPSWVRYLANSPMLKNYTHDVKRGLTEPWLLLRIFVSALAVVFANVCLYSAYASAPNPGMCDAVSSSASFVSLLLSAAVLGSSIHERAVFGMVSMAFAGYLLAG
jgi:drug/metabolite transporter (DMT)-like permease